MGSPAEVTTDAGTATVLVLRGAQSSDFEAEYQVICRHSRLGQLVANRIRVGDHVVAAGALELSSVVGPVEDLLSAARVTLEADIVALDVRDAPSATTEPGPTWLKNNRCSGSSSETTTKRARSTSAVKLGTETVRLDLDVLG